MDPSVVASVNSAVAAENATTKTFDDLSSEDFFALLIAELQTQDPLDPQDNEQILNQMSSIRQMEQNTALTETLEMLAAEQRFGGTSALIGHYIAGTVTDTEGVATEIQGLVIGVRFEDDNAILELHNGRQLPADKVEQVTLLENLPDEILEQLQAELDAQSGDSEEEEEGEGEGEGGGEGDAGDAAAKAIRAAAQKAAAAKSHNRGQGVDVVGGLLDALFSPGVGVKVGA